MKVFKFLGFCAIACAAVLGVNHLRVNSIASSTTESRSYLSAKAYYRYLVDPSNIVFDVRSVTGEASAAGVLGGFFNFAEGMKDRDFNYVYLASNGTLKYRIRGSYFKEIGQTLSYQNPVYLARTFPERVQTLDGRKPFETWTGGVLGVMSAQMDDLNNLSRKWWLEDAIKSW